MYSNLKSFSFEKYSHVTFLHSSKLKFLEKIRQPCVVTQFTWHEDAQQCLVIHLHLGMALMISQNLNPLHSRKLAENAWHRCGTWDNWSVSRATYRCMPHGKSASIPAIHVVALLLQNHPSKLRKCHYHLSSLYPFGTHRMGWLGL